MEASTEAAKAGASTPRPAVPEELGDYSAARILFVCGA